MSTSRCISELNIVFVSDHETSLSSSTQEPQWADLPVPALALVLAELGRYHRDQMVRDPDQSKGSMLFTTIPLVCQPWRKAALSATPAIKLSEGTRQQLEALALWLQNHGYLLKELDVTGDIQSQTREPLMPDAADEFADVLGPALEAAAAKAAGSSNTHPAQLQLQAFSCNLPDAATLTLFSSPSTLTRLELMGVGSDTAACPPGPSVASAIAQLPQLRSLKLTGDNCPVEWEPASTIPSQCITAASQLTSLTRLFLMDTPANPPLHHLPTSLQDLVLESVPPPLGSDSAELPPFSIGHLAQLQSFACPAVYGGKQLQQLSSLQHLTSLSLEWSGNMYMHFHADPSDPDAACWVGPKLRQLQVLCLWSCPGGDAVVQALPRSLASSLRHLDVSMSDVSNAAMPALVTLTALRLLDLSDNYDITELPSVFANLTGLSFLSLSSTRVNDRSLVPLQKLQQLERLWLDHCPCTKERLQVLKDKLPRLEWFSHECFEGEEVELED